MRASSPQFSWGTVMGVPNMTPDELRALRAQLDALVKRAPEFRDHLLVIERELRRFGTAWRQHFERLFPPGTDLAQVRLGWIIPPPQREPTSAVRTDQKPLSRDEAIRVQLKNDGIRPGHPIPERAFGRAVRELAKVPEKVPPKDLSPRGWNNKHLARLARKMLETSEAEDLKKT
jgi:hypothetical protein